MNIKTKLCAYLLLGYWQICFFRLRKNNPFLSYIFTENSFEMVFSIDVHTAQNHPMKKWYKLTVSDEFTERVYADSHPNHPREEYRTPNFKDAPGMYRWKKKTSIIKTIFMIAPFSLSVFPRIIFFELKLIPIVLLALIPLVTMIQYIPVDILAIRAIAFFVCFLLTYMAVKQ